MLCPCSAFKQLLVRMPNRIDASVKEAWIVHAINEVVPWIWIRRSREGWWLPGEPSLASDPKILREPLEAQLYGMRVGQPASITVDALHHAGVMGRIESFSPATGSEFSVLKPDNATGNFTKVAQRLPIRIALDPGQPLASRLVPGMSVVVSIDTETSAAPSKD